MINVFNVESPLQLKMAQKAIEDLKLINNALVINMSNSTNNTNQMVRVLDKALFSKIIYINESKSGKKVKTFGKVVSPLLSLLKHRVNYYFYGEYRNKHMRRLGFLLMPKKVLLLDDGAYTITAQRSINKTKPALLPNVDKVIRPNLYSVFKFTQYPEGRKNYFDHHALVPKKVEIGSSVFVMGSKFSEAHIVSPDQELKFLSYVYNLYKQSKDQVYYFPHREESQDKLEKIASIGYTVKTMTLPFELYLQQSRDYPSVIASFASTVAYNIFIEYENIELVNFDITDFYIDPKRVVSANNINAYYSEIGIETIKIDKQLV
ncbi:hypothetical protein [Vibrio hippocampi]|uniref:CMP-N-acetylneuraminate-beta-galactosamide-alpha-2, 3-sialyltransferase n=1 Tax=Vibrio hippocampi TaxID=654686 RepID=A0ABM8ZK96_9VIBR|nr:hypothetical protein [Vibrio hippocampi]CAH0527232.1 hypothetical protein VHP8226_02560 [Vibrio hippocampi]